MPYLPSYGWPLWVPYIEPEMIHCAQYGWCRKDSPRRSPTEILYDVFKPSQELLQAQDAMRKVLRLDSHWGLLHIPKEKFDRKASSLFLWEMRATQVLNSTELAEVINSTFAELGYTDYFYYYEGEEPPRYDPRAQNHHRPKAGGSKSRDSGVPTTLATAGGPEQRPSGSQGTTQEHPAPKPSKMVEPRRLSVARRIIRPRAKVRKP